MVEFVVDGGFDPQVGLVLGFGLQAGFGFEFEFLGEEEVLFLVELDLSVDGFVAVELGMQPVQLTPLAK